MGATANDGDESLSRAELFEALSHPIRVRILESLESAPLRFSDLKRAAGIQSNGHLEFHLRKLSGLVTSTETGDYSLTDDGREALTFLRSARFGEFGRRFELPNLRMIGILVLVVGLLVSGSVLVVVGQTVGGQTAWQGHGGLVSTGPYSRLVPPGGVYDLGYTPENAGTYMATAAWETSSINGANQLVFAVLGVPPGTNLTEVLSNSTLANSLILTSSIGSNFPFVSLTFTLPEPSGIQYVLFNGPTPVNVTFAGVNEEIQYYPNTSTGSELEWFGGILLVLASVSLVGLYLASRHDRTLTQSSG